MNSRQVHIDFHTSEFIPNVAKKFDKMAFAQHLKRSHVDSATCFARCHHGWLYYPSKKFADRIHPELTNSNLLIEQIDACHELGIKAPIYTTVQWDGLIAREHPEWLARDIDGYLIDTQGVPEPHFYYTLCLNSPYRDYIKEHIQDIIEVIGKERIDGFFFDILFRSVCCCDYCKKEMIAENFDPTDIKDQQRYAVQMIAEFKKEMSQFIWNQLPDVSLFFNGSHIGYLDKESLPAYSHIELESLPSGGWGYDHFPITMRYARNLGKDVIGMTGKFHTYWGDFHSLKNQAALEFEVYHMLALGAKGCSIGDQLHPDGQLSEAAYQLIQSVYERVETVEEVCRKVSKPVVEVGVLTPEEYWFPGSKEPRTSPAIIGLNRMLQELNYQFDIIDSEMDFEKYQVIILPDEIPPSKELLTKLQHFMQMGGFVIATYHSLIDLEQVEQPFLGICYQGEGSFDRDYILPNHVIGCQLPKEEFVMYGQGVKIACMDAQEILQTVKPYFNREGKTFCSHQHAPSSHQLGDPGAVRYGNMIYFSHPIFSLYRKNGAKWLAEIINDALKIGLPQKLITHNGPKTLLTTLNQDEEGKNYLLHALHYIIQKQTEDIYTIDEKISLRDTIITVILPSKKVMKVYDAVSGEVLPFDQQASSLVISVPMIDGYKIIKIECE